MNIFSGKMALITGGSSGIGLAVAKQLASRKCNVWILARRDNRLQSAKKEIEKCRASSSVKVGILSTDVSHPKSIIPVLEKFTKTNGIPDILVNSAGISYPGEFISQNLGIFRSMMNTNYLGTVYPSKIIASGMVERRSGIIVNISSIAGFIGAYGYAAYGGSKFAVRGFSDIIRTELKPYGIQVCVVFPPDTDTPQFAFENKHKPEITRIIDGNVGLLSADQVAAEILKGIERKKYIIIPGMRGKILYLMNNLLGRLVYPIMDLIISQARNTLSKKSEPH